MNSSGSPIEFHSLIREDEQQQIEASIWEQIDSGNENDYIHFIFDGQILSFCTGSWENCRKPQYGKVFYVLFMDWEDMHIHYSDKFSG
ncbi:MAG: PAS domain S-box protein [Gallintestinimicrobium sp.]